MFNLLPESLKEKIEKDYKLRRLIVILLFALLIEISFFIFMIPSWVSSHYREKEATLRVEKMNESKLVNSVNSIIPVIRSLNGELVFIDRNLEYIEVMPLIDSIISNKTASIKINQITYSANSSTTATMNITGISLTRDSLVNFKKSLDDLKVFKSVDVPISNFAKDKNIKFDMAITISVKQ